MAHADHTTHLDSETVEALRHALAAARTGLLRDHESNEDELDAIEAEREIEWEEMAQEEHAADVRTRLSSQQYAQLRQVDGALERIEQGSYGVCIDCGTEIPLERLRAQPWAATCAACAEEREARDPDISTARPQDKAGDLPDGRDDQHAATTPLPPELESLDDAEVVEAIREAFQNEVGEALDDVRIIARDGVVILAGEVPNETLPDIARRIVEDEVGYEVVDRLMVTEFAGEPAEPAPQGVSGGQLPTDEIEIDEEAVEGEVSDDVLEVEEEGLIFVPPTRPVPER